MMAVIIDGRQIYFENLKTIVFLDLHRKVGKGDQHFERGIVKGTKHVLNDDEANKNYRTMCWTGC